VTCLCHQHTRWCDWEMFEVHKEFLDEVRRKGAKLGKRMVYEKYLKDPLGWILGTIKRELNLFDLTGNETL
jgi:hypothetical protein